MTDAALHTSSESIHAAAGAAGVASTTDLIKFTSSALRLLGEADADAPWIHCAKCGRSERMSNFHQRLFAQWHRRPNGTKYLPSVRVDESKVSPIAGNGLFAAQSISKNALITYYPAHAVVSSDDGVDHSFFVNLSRVPMKEITSDKNFGTNLTKRCLTHLVNGCGLNVMSWPSCTRRSDELGDCANDNINFVALLPLFSAFFKSPNSSTYGAFAAAVDAYNATTNCALVTNCFGKYEADGSLYMRAARHGDGGADCTAVPVPSLIATRDIEDGEELTVSYGARYWLCDMYMRHKSNVAPNESVQDVVAEFDSIMASIH